MALTRPELKLRDSLKLVIPDDSGPSPQDMARQYGLGPQELVLLHRNESPYGPSPSAIQALCTAPANRYTSQEPFVSAAARTCGLPEDMIISGPGLDGVLDCITRLFLERGRSALIPIPTYTYYELLARLCGADVRILPWDGRSADALLPHLAGADMIFLCSPNNPTGAAISEETVKAIVESASGVVFLDEAYAEFAGTSLIRLVERYDNLVVGRTLSKAYGLAGLRLAYAAAPPWIADQYRRIAPAFGISSSSLAAGQAALEDQEYMQTVVEKIKKERERMRGVLVEAALSEANFLFIETGEDSSMVAATLMRKGIVVKDCSAIAGCGHNHIRVTVGRPEENEQFLAAYISGC
ncbi:MAG TPA: histidinol-phosphate transaminase [Methanotrichaceae archaeon]|nr:histidinol-phosphate transaminase [Methanotrichaceae archaeon]HQF16841.1 histidinol-phosphate transaminase [Methanotrichaceae archaeon]HQI90167.1 histidinol-phosphate transaminase [Methanotrichaceae archaeon]HQJ29111.1 histidinol-phosphate transaminase [Methanotrichaceae archaeon]